MSPTCVGMNRNCRFTVCQRQRYNTAQITLNEKEKAMYPMCPFSGNAMSAGGGILCFGVKVFLLIWVVFVPIAITSRLEKIIKLLEDKKK